MTSLAAKLDEFEAFVLANQERLDTTPPALDLGTVFSRVQSPDPKLPEPLS